MLCKALLASLILSSTASLRSPPPTVESHPIPRGAFTTAFWIGFGAFFAGYSTTVGAGLGASGVNSTIYGSPTPFIPVVGGFLYAGEIGRSHDAWLSSRYQYSNLIEGMAIAGSVLQVLGVAAMAVGLPLMLTTSPSAQSATWIFTPYASSAEAGARFALKF